MINFKFILPSIILLMASFNVNAAMSVEEYEKLKNHSTTLTQNATPESIAIFVVDGIRSGIWIMNERLRQLGQPQIYCEPSNMSLNGFNYMQIMEKAIRIAKENKLTENVQQVPIESFMLIGLVNDFPCPNK